MVALPNNGGRHSPPSPKWRRKVLHAEVLPLSDSWDLPGRVVLVGKLPAAAASVLASEDITAQLLVRFSCIPMFLEEHLHEDYYQGFSMKYLTLHSTYSSCDIFRFGAITKDLVCRNRYVDVLPFDSSRYRYSSAADSLSICNRSLEVSCDSYISHGCSMIDHMDRTVVVVKNITASSGKACHLREILNLPEIAAIVKANSTKYKGRKLLLDVKDDCHGTLEAMETLLESQPELRGQLVLVVMTVNTWQLVSAVVLVIRDRINSGFGFPGHDEPVVLINVPPMHEQLAFHMLGGGIIASTLSSQKKFFDYRADLSALRRKRLHDSVCRLIEIGNKNLEHYKNRFSMGDPGYWTRSFEQDLETDYRSILQDYVRPQVLSKASAMEVFRFLKVMHSDKNNITSVSGRRMDKSAIWLGLHKLIMSAYHGYSTSPQHKNSTFSERIPSCLAQLVASCNSSAALRHPSRRRLVRFLLDSGASMHVVGDAGLLHNPRQLSQAEALFVTLPDGSRMPIIGVGNIQIDGFNIPNVYLVEGLTVNLVSVSRLANEHGICCCFFQNRCQLMLLADGQIQIVGEAVLENDGAYGLRFLRIPGATA